VLPRQFASQKALLDYAEQKGLVYMWAYTQRERVLSPAFIAREHLLSPDQYELVDVRTRSGVRRALLFPKAILQAEFAANREVLASKRERWRAKRAAKQLPTMNDRRTRPRQFVGEPPAHERTIDIRYSFTISPAPQRCMLTSQEGWDAEKRVHEPKGVTGPR
jgi:hypothetical protein